MYPDYSIQGVLSPTPWWEKDSNRDYQRGRLVKFFAPHVDQIPFTLIPVGRDEATEHNTALVKIAPLDIRSLIRYPQLPVAALPQYKKEVRAVYRAKKRPGLIVCSGGTKISKILTWKHLLKEDEERAVENKLDHILLWLSFFCFIGGATTSFFSLL